MLIQKGMENSNILLIFDTKMKKKKKKEDRIFHIKCVGRPSGVL